jgi:hypothetical protein
MTRLCRLGFVVVAFASMTSLRCPASDHVVYVHVVDAKTGNAILRGNLEMKWGKPREHERALKEKIGPDGTAAFHLDDPPPVRVRIRLGKSMGYWYECSPGTYDTNEILQHGVSEQADIWPDTKFPNVSDKFHSKPGEVHFFAGHIPLHEFLKTWLKGFK